MEPGRAKLHPPGPPNGLFSVGRSDKNAGRRGSSLIYTPAPERLVESVLKVTIKSEGRSTKMSNISVLTRRTGPGNDL